MFEPGTRVRYRGHEGTVKSKPKWAAADDSYYDVLIKDSTWDGVWLALPDELEVIDV